MMQKVNLLPWREWQRRQHQQRFYRLIACAGLVGALWVLLGHLYFSHQIDSQYLRNQQLEVALAQLESELAEKPLLEQQKQAYQDRLVVLAAIQADRNRMTQLLGELPEVVPPGVYLQGITKTETLVEFKGRSDSNGRLASLLANAEQAEWIDEVKMHEIAQSRSFPTMIRFKGSFEIRE